MHVRPLRQPRNPRDTHDLPRHSHQPRLQPLDATETADFYPLCVERHRKAATIVTSNRTAEEWLPVMADPLLAQSAVDRLTSTCYELVIEGESYRRRQKPGLPAPAATSR